jgi:hypothetical protein
MKEKQTISSEDLNLILVTDSIEESIQFIKEKSIAKYGLVAGRKTQPNKWLFERD